MKGILFKPDMIKAIVEGRKTVTRRVIKPNFEAKSCKNSDIECYCNTEYKGNYMFKIWHPCNDMTPLPLMIRSHYQVGEVVYIKEAHHIWKDEEMDSQIWYKLDWLLPKEQTLFKWTSPLFLKAEFARHFIKIKDVRAERLQEITEEEVIKEGFKSLADFIEKWDKINFRLPYYDRKTRRIVCYYSYPYSGEPRTEIYRNKPHHIIPNPYVFRYEFEYLKEKP